MPVAEHPLFPGSSQALSLTETQYEILKENNDVVFASVIKNDDILKREVDLVQQMLDPRKLEHDKQPDFNLPLIKSLDDVYQTGVLCNARVYKDEKNFFMPFILNLFPIEKAMLVSLVTQQEHIQPLCRVIIEKIREEMV